MLLRETNEGCTVLAPAKLNLCLEILGRLPHGYHEIRTLMCPIRWFDTLSVRSKEVADQEDPIELHVHGAKDVPVGKDNLVAAALSELKCHAGCKKGVRVDLVKRIPSQAGLGGGSSDAAAALIAANRLWRLGLSCDDLKAIGAGLGSDIPFFIHAIMARGGCSAGGARAAICTGRGEQVESTPSVGGGALRDC